MAWPLRAAQPLAGLPMTPPVDRMGTRDQGETAMSVATITEISATLSESFDDAVRQGLARATQTLSGVTAAWVKEQRVTLENGRNQELPGEPADHLRPRGRGVSSPRTSPASTPLV
jgi:flavin-binding protein dodecin